MTKYTLGIVGCGFVAQQCHLPCYSSNASFNIKYIADPVIDLRNEIARKYGIHEQFDSHLDLLLKDDLDAVVVTLPRKLTFGVIHDLCNSGINVITEKPLCLNYKNAKKLLEVQRIKQNILMTGYMKQHDKGVKQFIQEINAISREEIISIRAYCHMGNSYASPFGDKKGEFIPALDNNSVEAMPDWLPEDLHWSYEQFINVFSHITQLLEHIFGKQLQLSSQLVNKRGEGLILAEIGSTPVCLDLMRGEQYEWYEGIEVHTATKRIQLRLPAAFLRNQPATVEVNQGVSDCRKYTISPEWSWSFREQTFALEQALTKKYDHVRDLQLATSQIKFAENVFRNIVSRNG